MNTTENNKLLAEFMGHHLEHPLIDTYEPNGEDFKYDTSWDWLMEVVERIESINNSDFIIEYTSVMMPNVFGTKQFIAKTKIEATYKACVEFVEWYNKEQIIGREEKTKQ